MISISGGEIVKAGAKLFHNLNWKLQQGDNWVIAGSNGSGKTTLLELLAGIRYLTKGEIVYDFIDGDSWDERHHQKKKQIKYIPTHAIQSFVSSTHERYYQQRYYDIGDERTPLVSDVLGNIDSLSTLHIPDSLSIDHLLSLEVTRLSNGQLKKVLLVKSLLDGIPKMLLLDYPFEGLDHTSRKDLCDFIDYLSSRHSIVFVITDHGHQLPTVMNKRLILENCMIVKEESIAPEDSTALPVTSSIGEEKSDASDVIHIKDLFIRYGTKVILQNFNWTVKKGERWALVGRNGAGKTTLFSLIFADHPMAYSQQIFLFGRRRGSGESIWDIKRRISYLGPELVSYLNPDSILLTGKEYLQSIHKPWNESAYHNLAEYFDARLMLSKGVRTLSSGQLQLMLTIGCLLTDRELLLLDEPFQFLDPLQKSRVCRYIQSRLHPGTTLIMITHYEQEVREWTQHLKRL